ncbi:c-type cytochrome [Billgrantia azerbaijanica]|nr:c-type cytochrome [Halomonas azerbaijanica]
MMMSVKPRRPGWFAVLAGTLLLFGGALPGMLLAAEETSAETQGEGKETQETQEKQWGEYVIEDGKVDPGTYQGYLTYTRNCLACHGPDGLGSTFAPSLIRAAERRSFADFIGTIAAGREIQPGRVMPSFGDDPNVMKNVENIYRYMRARGEGGLGRGRPKVIESMKEKKESDDAPGETAQ